MGYESHRPVQLRQAKDDVQTFPTRFGALIVFDSVQGAVDIISGPTVSDIPFDLQAKCKITLLSGNAVQQGKGMDGSQVGFR